MEESVGERRVGEDFLTNYRKCSSVKHQVPLLAPPAAGCSPAGGVECRSTSDTSSSRGGYLTRPEKCCGWAARAATNLSAASRNLAISVFSCADNTTGGSSSFRREGERPPVGDETETETADGDTGGGSAPVCPEEEAFWEGSFWAADFHFEALCAVCVADFHDLLVDLTLVLVGEEDAAADPPDEDGCPGDDASPGGPPRRPRRGPEEHR